MSLNYHGYSHAAPVIIIMYLQPRVSLLIYIISDDKSNMRKNLENSTIFLCILLFYNCIVSFVL